MNPGNPIQNYFKCFMEQHKFFFDKEAFLRREKLLAMPLKELPAQELANTVGARSQADWAARLDNPDWQILRRLKTDGFLRSCSPTCSRSGASRALQVRFRSEVASGASTTPFEPPRRCCHRAPPGRTPDAHRQPGGHRPRTPPSARWEEMLEQPGCPNLYWAAGRACRLL